MLRTLIGADAFARGMQLYFERYDGTAATVEDFLGAFADSSGLDLGHFARWYEQAGTPVVAVETERDPSAGTLTLRFTQTTPPTPDKADKEPMVVPIVLGLVSADAQPVAIRHERVRDDGVFVLDRSADELTFSGVPPRSVPSLLRGFSAPVRLVLDLSEEELLVLARNDPDPFNRWQAVQDVAARILLRLVRAPGTERESIAALASALESGLAAASADPAFAALLLALPGENEIAQAIRVDVDPDAVRAARETMRRELGQTLASTLRALWTTPEPSGPYRPDAASAGRRALRNAALDLYAAAEAAEAARLRPGPVRRSNQHDRPVRGAGCPDDAWRRGARRDAGPVRRPLPGRAARARQVVRAAGLHPGARHPCPRAGSYDPPRLFARQPQPGALPDRRFFAL
jgi:aminopeptidase N